MDIEEAQVEYIGSPKGTKIVRAKAVREGVKVKAEGTPMEILTVTAILTNQLMWDTNLPLHEVFQAIEELIKEEKV